MDGTSYHAFEGGSVNDDGRASCHENRQIHEATNDATRYMSVAMKAAVFQAQVSQAAQIVHCS